jgi:hypothetical protein
VAVAVAEPTPGPDRDPLADSEFDSTPGAVADAAPSGEDFEDSWRELQVTFVDDPAAAVRGAAELLERAVAELRANLEDSDSTEDQRTAFRRYRDVYRTLR